MIGFVREIQFIGGDGDFPLSPDPRATLTGAEGLGFSTHSFPYQAIAPYPVAADPQPGPLELL